MIDFSRACTIPRSFIGYTREQAQVIDALDRCEAYMKTERVSEIDLGNDVVVNRSMYGSLGFVDSKSRQMMIYDEVLAKLGSVEQIVRELQKRASSSTTAA